MNKRFILSIFILFFTVILSPLRAGIKVDLTPEEKAWIKAHPVIKLGSLKHYPPLVFEDKDCQGWAEDYNRLINEKTGLNIQLVHDDWKKSIGLAKSGKLYGLFPIILHMKVLNSTQNFSTPTLSSYVFVFSHVNSTFKPLKLSDLKGKRVAYQANILHIKEILDKEPGLNILTFADQTKLLSALIEGKVDAILGNVNLEYEINAKMLPLKVSLVLTEHVVKVGYAVHKNYPLLLSIINKGISTVTKEEELALLKKWQIWATEHQSTLSLTPKETAWLKAHPVIRVGSDPFWKPIESRDKNGVFHGIAIDYLRRVEQLLGVQFIIDKQSSWQQLIEKAKKNEMEMFSCITWTEERENFLNFTKPYLSFPAKLFTRKDTSYITDLADLIGHKVAVVESYSFHHMLQRDFPDLELVPVPTIEDGLNKLQRGEVMAFIGNLLATGNIISEKGFSTIKVGGDTPYSNDLGMVSRKDWSILRDILQKALDTIPEQEKTAIYQKWVPLLVDKQTDYSLIWKISLPLLALLLVFILWNWTLKRQVALKTADLKKSEARLHQAQKMQAIGQLAGGIAHDFNNVLAGIIGFTEMSLLDAEAGSDLENNLKQTLAASDRAKNLVNQILSFSRQNEEKYSPILLAPVIKEVLDLFRASIPSSITITSDIQVDNNPILANSTKIHELLLNLTTNAVHAMQDKGVLTVRLWEEEIKHYQEGSLGTIPPGLYSLLEVTDTGCGMDKDTIDKIFEPFFTTKETGKGTGMGLSVVYGIILSHDGNIRVESTPGKGTTFYIYLPKTHDPATQSVTRSKTTPGGREKILLVDDEEMIIKMGSALLSSLGYTVVSTTSSTEALEILQNQNIDLLITDQTMPDMTGVELSAAALQIRKDLPVILCTGYSSTVTADMVKKLGIKKLCMKPLTKQGYAQAIREVLDK